MPYQPHNVRQPLELHSGEFASFVRCIEAAGELHSRRSITPVMFSAEEISEIDMLNETLPLREAIRLVLLARKET